MLLKDIKVIEIGQAIAGPLAGLILAELGAEVIKVEKPAGGDDTRQWGPYFANESVTFRTYNRSKKSVVVDMKAAADIARLKALMQTADVVIQNLRPGVVQDLGIGSEDACRLNERLVYCSISAFGNKGPMQHQPGFDPLLQAYSGVMSLTGRPGDPPTFCAPAINDKAAGMWAVIGILSALQQRAHSGKGCVVDTSLFESAVAWMEGQVSIFKATGQPPQRHGTGASNLTPYQQFETATKPLCLAIGNDRLFAKFATEVGHPEWLDDSRYATNGARCDNRDALVGLVQSELNRHGRETWITRFNKAGVPCAPINDVPDLVASEQLAEMAMLASLPRSGMAVTGLPITFNGKRPAIKSDSPELGEHNSELPHIG